MREGKSALCGEGGIGVILVVMGMHVLGLVESQQQQVSYPTVHHPQAVPLKRMSSSLVFCAASEMLVLSCTWNRYVGHFKPLPLAVGKDTKRPLLPSLSLLSRFHAESFMFVMEDAVLQLDWVFLGLWAGMSPTTFGCPGPHPAWSWMGPPRKGASTAPLGSLFQYLSTLSVKNFFLMSNLNLSSFSLKLFPIFYHYPSMFLLHDLTLCQCVLLALCSPICIPASELHVLA